MTGSPPDGIGAELPCLMRASIETHRGRVTCDLAIHARYEDTCGDLLQYSVGRMETPYCLDVVSRDT